MDGEDVRLYLKSCESMDEMEPGSVSLTVTPFDGKPRAIPIGQALRELNLLI